MENIIDEAFDDNIGSEELRQVVKKHVGVVFKGGVQYIKIFNFGFLIAVGSYFQQAFLLGP